MNACMYSLEQLWPMHTSYLCCRLFCMQILELMFFTIFSDTTRTCRGVQTYDHGSRLPCKFVQHTSNLQQQRKMYHAFPASREMRPECVWRKRHRLHSHSMTVEKYCSHRANNKTSRECIPKHALSRQ